MPSNRTPTTFYGPADVTLDTDVTLYTVPANKIAVIRYVAVTWDADALFARLGVGGVTPPDLFFDHDYPGVGTQTTDYWLYMVLTAAETLNCNTNSGDASAFAVTVTGDLYDV